MKDLIKCRPIGVGTPDCESLSSYITRLAKSNCVGPKILLSAIFDYLGIPQNNSTFGKHSMACIDGISGQSTLIADSVAIATGYDEVRFLTLARFASIMGPRNLLAVKRRWVQSELSSQESCYTPYEKLLWRLQTYRFNQFGEPVTHFCPSCHREMKVLAANQQIAECSHPSCKSDLGRPGYSQPPGGNPTSHGFWVWASGQLSQLIACCDDLPDISFEDAFVEWLNYYGIQRDSQVSRLLGVSHVSIQQWRAGSIPGLDNFLNICWCFRTTLLDFLRLRMLPMEDSDGPRESPIKDHKRQKSHRRRPIDKEEMCKQLTKILVEDQYPHLSFTQICKAKLDRHAQVVHACFPDLAKQLAARHKQRRLETAKISRAGNLAQIREAARILREKGERITQRAIKGLLPTPSIMANDWARAAAKAEVKA